MKAICRLKTKIDGNKITITGDIIDVTAPLLVAQRHTIPHPVNGHPSKPRHFQANTHGLAILRHGADGVLFPKDELASVALEIDSKLTDVPVFTKHPTKDDLKGQVISELPATGKIQTSADGKRWNDAPDDCKRADNGER